MGGKVSYYLVLMIWNLIPTMSRRYRPWVQTHQVFHSNLSGLEPPRLDSTGGVATGANTPKHRIENKHRRKATLANQAFKSQWTIYQGEFELPVPPTPLEMHQGEMSIWLGSPSPHGRPPQGMGYLWVPYQHRNAMDARTDASCGRQGTSLVGFNRQRHCPLQG